MRASLACEGMVLTAEEEALFDAMERERLSPDERAARITQFSRPKGRQKAPARVLLQLAGEDQPMFELNTEEEASFQESLAQADRGEFATDEETRVHLGEAWSEVAGVNGE